MLSKHAIQVTAEYTYTDQVIKFEIIIDITLICRNNQFLTLFTAYQRVYQ